jgi:hypothetical protein
MLGIFYDFIEREWYFIAPNQEYKIPKEHFDFDLLEDVEIELSSAETTNIYSDILTGTMDAYVCDFE